MDNIRFTVLKIYAKVVKNLRMDKFAERKK